MRLTRTCSAHFPLVSTEPLLLGIPLVYILVTITALALMVPLTSVADVGHILSTRTSGPWAHHFHTVASRLGRLLHSPHSKHFFLVNLVQPRLHPTGLDHPTEKWARDLFDRREDHFTISTGFSTLV